MPKIWSISLLRAFASFFVCARIWRICTRFIMNSTITAANRPEGATNPLYIRMRNRFDFSGNRTIGEFMTMKANREGYCAPAKSAAPRRAASHRPLVSLVSLLLSAVLGCERSGKRHAAGLRTFIIVALGGTVVTLFDVYLMQGVGLGFPLLSAAARLFSSLLASTTAIGSMKMVAPVEEVSWIRPLTSLRYSALTGTT